MSKTNRKPPPQQQRQPRPLQSKRRKQWEAMELPNLEPRPLDVPVWKPLG